MVIDEMIQLSAFRLSAVGNDFGWDRARFDQELETDAYAMRIVLGANPEKPDLPQDLNVTIPEGFTTFHDSVGPNQPAPGLQHLQPHTPRPLPTRLVHHPHPRTNNPCPGSPHQHTGTDGFHRRSHADSTRCRTPDRSHYWPARS
jgi:hypothetical protein